MLLFLPLGTTRPCWRVPYVTCGLIGLNILVFALQLTAEHPFALAYVPAHPSLVGWFASLFMHGDVPHLLWNMLFLWLFATLTEDVFGPWVMLGFYFASDLGATILHSLVGLMFAPQSLEVEVVGASGAIAGIMGLSAVCFFRTRVRVWYLVGYFFYWRTGVVEVVAPVFLGLWAGLEVVQGLVGTSMEAAYGDGSGVAHWAHVGGFAVGLAGALALKLKTRVARADLVEGRRPVSTDGEAFAQWGELQQTVKRKPEDAEAWYALGRIRESRGQVERAAEAYGRALALFLGQRKWEDAVKAYRGVKEYQRAPALSESELFQLGCALEEAGRKKDAFTVFQQLALAGGVTPLRETALIRAGEIAMDLPGHQEQAADCYEALLRDFPYGPWRGLATDRLEGLGRPPRERRPGPAPAPPPAPAEEGKEVSRFERLERRPRDRREPKG